MLSAQSIKIQSIPISINLEELTQVIENAIKKDPTIVIKKLDNVNYENKILSNEQQESINIDTNCLALTVKKDYTLSIAKNAVLKSIRMTFKVAVSTLFLNIAKIFL